MGKLAKYRAKRDEAANENVEIVGSENDVASIVKQLPLGFALTNGNRPLTLVRYPEGRTKPGFFQQKLPRSSSRITVQDMPGLVELAQLGTLEILELRRRLGDLNVESWVKTTGGKGLHVCFPVERRLGWADFKAWSKLLADRLAHDDPTQFTSNMAKSARKGRIYVDYLRNGRNATFIAPYSPRAREGAPVAVPVSWDELARGVDPAAFTMLTLPQRLAPMKKDPWDGIYETKQTLKRKP